MSSYGYSATAQRGREQYNSATTTANSEAEGRLKVDVGSKAKKKKLLKKHLKRLK